KKKKKKKKKKKLQKKEFDYRKEANNLRTVYDNVMPAYGNDVCIPRPMDGLCTKNLLVMSFIPGEKLEVAIRGKLREYLSMKLGRHVTEQDIPSEQLLQEIRKQFWKKDNEREIKAGGNPTLRLLSIRGGSWFGGSLRFYRYLLSARRYLYNALAFCFNCTLALLFVPLTWIDSRSVSVPYLSYDAPIVPNPERFLKTLLSVHGYQIFKNGAFNGDPHPGNILLMPDGRLGLIDYGQFKYLSKDERKHLAELIIALADRNSERIVEKAKEIGFRSKHMDPYFIEVMTTIGFDRLDNDIRKGMSSIEFFTLMRNLDEPVKIPGNYYLVQRTVFLLRGLSQLLQFECSVAQHWKPFAQRFLLENLSQ
ncbi:hypothetical protein RFI_28857, partial [Reticulomyxa filosa]